MYEGEGEREGDGEGDGNEEEEEEEGGVPTIPASVGATVVTVAAAATTAAAPAASSPAAIGGGGAVATAAASAEVVSPATLTASSTLCGSMIRNGMEWHAATHSISMTLYVASVFKTVWIKLVRVERGTRKQAEG
jgi:hypothetical protein